MISVTDYRTLHITLFHQCITCVLYTQYCCIIYVTPTYQSPLLSYCIPLFYVFILPHFYRFRIKSLMQFLILQSLHKLLSKFSDSNTVAKLKDIKCKAFKIFMENLLQVFVLVIFVNCTVACQHIGNIAVDDFFYVVLFVLKVE